MGRNWGIPNKTGRGILRDPNIARPILTLISSAAFGVIAAVLSGYSFSGARSALSGLFQGGSVVAAVIAAGFGCWCYVWIARPRFAAQFTGRGDVFSKLLRFYAAAAIILNALYFASTAILSVAPAILGIFFLCMTGGAAAAAAFQTVLAFVPYYDDPATED